MAGKVNKVGVGGRIFGTMAKGVNRGGIRGWRLKVPWRRSSRKTLVRESVWLWLWRWRWLTGVLHTLN